MKQTLTYFHKMYDDILHHRNNDEIDMELQDYILLRILWTLEELGNLLNSIKN